MRALSPAETPSAARPGGDEALADLAARVEALARQNEELLAGQRALRAQLEAMQAHANLVGHLVQQVHGQRFAPRELPLPLARLRDLVREPGPSLAFLREMALNAVVTSTRLRQEPAGGWRRRARPLRAARNFGRDFSGLVYGRRSLVYRVEPRHAPVGERPRVLHVIANVFVGGSTQLVVDLHEWLGHRYEMQVLTAALPLQGRHEGMVLHHLPLGSPAAAFTHVLRAVDPDIVHLHYWGGSDQPWYEAALEAARASRAVLLQNVNTPVEPLRDARIHRHLFVSDYIREAFAPDIGNGEVIHPGIDLDRFAPPESWAPGAADTVGMVYRLVRDKLDDSSIDPLILVARRRPRTRFLIVGDGELLPVFHRKVAEAGCRDNFEFTGIVPFARLPEIYRQFRIFVAPVVRESFGQVTPFAMAMGQAVAGFRTGALPEILGSCDTLGETREALADILVDLLERPGRVEEIGRANIARAQRFSLDGMIRAYGRAYAAALGRDPDLMPGFPPAELYREL
ncbi:glycosyltransferase family 4 protein [Xanthobacter sp. V0B-10]|uniref:glycosyltransferase family 4 protein n=1 Tax=Xanthobacter albus TaxID=3119929 RepID=UPI003727BF64